MAHHQRRLYVNALANWSLFLANMLIAFFLAPFLIRVLGVGRYGVWVFVESILTYFMLFDLGIGAGVVRFISRYFSKNLPQEINRLVCSSLALFCALGLSALALGLALQPVLVPMVSKHTLAAGEVGIFMSLMLVLMALMVPLNIYPAILDGLERFQHKNMIRLFFVLVRTLALVFFIPDRPDLIRLGTIYIITALIEYLALALACRFFLPTLRYRWQYVDWLMLKEIMSYSLHAFLAMVAGRVSVQSGIVLIGIFLSAPEVTWYAIALRLVEFAKALPRSATSTITPAVSSLEAQGQQAAIRETFLRWTRVLLLLMVPVQVGLLIFGRPFLRLWIGTQEAADHCFPVLVVLAPSLLPVVAQSVAARVLYGIGVLKLFARATLVEAVLNLGAALILIHQAGILGVAWAATIPGILLSIAVVIYTCRLIDCHLSHYLYQAWLVPVILGGLIALFWFRYTGEIQNWWELSTRLLLGLIPYSLVLLFLVLVPKYRRVAIPAGARS